MSSTPVTTELLAAYVLGDLPPDDRRAVDQALAASPSLRAALERVRRTVGALSEPCLLVDPPVSSVQRALRLVQRSESTSWLDRAANAIATLVFDSLSGAVVPGFRGGGAADARHMTFECDQAEVDLEIHPPSPGSPTRRVLGQVAVAGGPAPTRVGFARVAESGPERAREAAVDNRGRFDLQLAAGVWEVRISLGDDVLALPQFTIA